MYPITYCLILNPILSHLLFILQWKVAVAAFGPRLVVEIPNGELAPPPRAMNGIENQTFTEIRYEGRCVCVAHVALG